jgi:hypothetical protein
MGDGSFQCSVQSIPPARRATMPVDDRCKEPDMSTHRHAQEDRDGAADTVLPPIDIKLAVVVPAGT